MKYKKDKFFSLLEEYFSSCLPIAKGLSEKTIVSYKTAFRLLFEYLIIKEEIPAVKIVFSTLTVECIQRFLDWLENDRQCSVSTRNQRLSAIASFADFAQSRDFGNASVFRKNIMASGCSFRDWP
ncbi:MAG: phage integrase N-terminal SAM-like domain-containing protein [Lachnospiraceae bacterium]